MRIIMPCNYCGSAVNLVMKELHVEPADGMPVEKISVCPNCFKKYNTKLFDSCDKCKELYEMHLNVFHLIEGKVLCQACKESYMAYPRHEERGFNEPVLSARSKK